jgi:transcription initiation factor TFIIB
MDELTDFDNMSELELLSIFDNDDNNKDKKDLKNICSTCNNNSIVKDITNGIVVCNSCGQIKEYIIDDNPEWRKYNNTKSYMERCTVASNPFLPKSSIGTSIGGNYKSKLKMLHTWTSMPYKERSLNNVLKDIKSKCYKGNILKCIQDEAMIMYKNIDDCHYKNGPNKGKPIITRGANRRSLIAACVYFACKLRGESRSIREIGCIFKLDYTEVTRGCKTFLKLKKLMKIQYKFKPSSPEHFIPRYCKLLNINKKFIDEAVKIAINTHKLNIASVHTPLSIATGAILIMAEDHQLPITKKIISKNFGVSDVTVTKAYKLIKPKLDILKSNEATDFYMKLMEMDRQKIKKNNKTSITSYCSLLSKSTEEIYTKIKNENKIINNNNINIIESINNTSKEYNTFIKKINF